MQLSEEWFWKYEEEKTGHDGAEEVRHHPGTDFFPALWPVRLISRRRAQWLMVLSSPDGASCFTHNQYHQTGDRNSDQTHSNTLADGISECLETSIMKNETQKKRLDTCWFRSILLCNDALTLVRLFQETITLCEPEINLWTSLVQVSSVSWVRLPDFPCLQEREECFLVTSLCSILLLLLLQVDVPEHCWSGDLKIHRTARVQEDQQHLAAADPERVQHWRIETLKAEKSVLSGWSARMCDCEGNGRMSKCEFCVKKMETDDSKD